MKLRFLSVLSFVCLLMILGGRVGSAQQVQPLEPEWLRQMYEEGWEKVQEGVLRRDVGNGQYETFSYGAEGLHSVVQGYEQELAFLEERYNKSPSEDLAGLIERVRGEIDKLSENLEAAPSAEAFDGSAFGECADIDYGGDASAGPMESTQGVTATATAFFQNGCGIIGDTFARAYAEVVDPVTFLHDFDGQNDPSQGTSVVSSAIAGIQGSAGCYSYADASVTINGDMVFQTPFAQNSTCSLPVQVTITGPATVTTDYYTNACADVTWTASANQGNPGYTYEWYIGAALQGTGATLTKSYCNVSKLETVRVVATDTRGWSDDATFTMNIQHVGPLVATVSGPSSVTTNSETPCANVTWTASVSGAHPGYTYSWYLGTGTTVQGTGSTLTKQYCNTSTSVAAKVVVRDSDGHTTEATKTTTITHTGPVTVSIAGPATVNTDYYFNACANVTWTASASQGTPGYTYQWYIGKDSQGTGATLTKNYCNTSQSITVRVVATDSQGGTDDETFTTDIQYVRPLNASVSGLTSVATNSSTPCANVTWTASATRAHPGYTYSWYIGTGTTVQGTGSTFTKQYCNTSTSVTVKVVARDSDGHTDDATMTTTITHTTSTPPVTASISGPAEVWIYAIGECRNLTWTASATGGTSGYTYTWYLGTSTTAVGTGSTLTKNFCGTQTINVKVIARDSSSPAKTDDATFTTIIYREYTDPVCGLPGKPACD